MNVLRKQYYNHIVDDNYFHTNIHKHKMIRYKNNQYLYYLHKNNYYKYYHYNYNYSYYNFHYNYMNTILDNYNYYKSLPPNSVCFRENLPEKSIIVYDTGENLYDYNYNQYEYNLRKFRNQRTS